jgi:CheY-like chemotaxis protein
MAMQGNTTKNKESVITRHDGSIVWCLASSAPIYDDEGILIGAIYAAIDITERKKNEQIIHELINLIGNALKFTEIGSVTCGCKLENNKLIFHVSDTGVGIPKDKHEYIFERFSQLHPLPQKNLGGTGLGLSIVKGLTNLLGGKVWLESELGKGTTFYFSINYVKTDNGNVQNQTDKTTLINQNSNLTILIVEDDYYNSVFLKEILSPNGFKIMQTEFGQNAIQIAINNPIDLILMDIRLPDITGYEASKAILQFKPNIKIIAQTAYAANDEREKALQNGCVDYISKPTKRHLLLSLIKKHLT